MNPPTAGRWLDRPVARRWLLLVGVLAAAAAVVFGALVSQGERRGERAGRVRGVAVEIARIPDTLKALAGRQNPWELTATEPLPAGFTETPNDGFRDPGFAILAGYAPDRGAASVRLMRLADGAILHEWRPDLAALARRVRETRVAGRGEGVPIQIGHPLLLADGGLVFNVMSAGYLLVRVDRCGRTLWAQPGYHHSVQPAGADAVWAPAVRVRPRNPDFPAAFLDDQVVRVGLDGRRRGGIDVGEMLERNGMGGIVSGRPYTDDPYHLNDIQPVPGDGPYWRRGDVFLSLRNQSMVLLYRPATGRIVWHQSGPWRGQHDVEILDDHRITIFDNNVVPTPAGGRVAGHSRVAVHDFATGKTSYPFDAAFARQRIATTGGGIATPLDNGDLFVEERAGGRLMRLDGQGNLRWRYVQGDGAMKRYSLSWSRYLDPRRDAAGIAAATTARCG